MHKIGCFWLPALALVCGALIAFSIIPRGPSQAAIDAAFSQREAQEAQRLAIQNKVLADSAPAKTAALATFQLGLGFAAAILAMGGAGVGVWWMWTRSQLVYPKVGLYPLMARPGLRMQVYNPNLLAADPATTARAQAIQLAASMRGELAPHERRAAVHDIAGVFVEQAPQLPMLGVSTYETSHVARLLLEADNDSDD